MGRMSDRRLFVFSFPLSRPPRIKVDLQLIASIHDSKMSSLFGFQNEARSKQLLESHAGPVKYAGLNGNSLLYVMVATAT
jgi:hypothetical protein